MMSATRLTAKEAMYAHLLFERSEMHDADAEAVWDRLYEAAEAGRSVDLDADEAALVLAQFDNTDAEWDARTGNRLAAKLGG